MTRYLGETREVAKLNRGGYLVALLLAEGFSPRGRNTRELGLEKKGLGKNSPPLWGSVFCYLYHEWSSALGSSPCTGTLLTPSLTKQRTLHHLLGCLRRNPRTLERGRYVLSSPMKKQV